MLKRKTRRRELLRLQLVAENGGLSQRVLIMRKIVDVAKYKKTVLKMQN